MSSWRVGDIGQNSSMPAKKVRKTRTAARQVIVLLVINGKILLCLSMFPLWQKCFRIYSPLLYLNVFFSQVIADNFIRMRWENFFTKVFVNKLRGFPVFTPDTMVVYLSNVPQVYLFTVHVCEMSRLCSVLIFLVLFLN